MLTLLLCLAGAGCVVEAFWQAYLVTSQDDDLDSL